MEEKFTLIWSFRNRFDILKKSIESAHNNTPGEVDFCLVDACSNDDTIKKLREYCNGIKTRKIRICESSYRSNLSEAWNLGMMLTENRYAIFSSSDVTFKSPSWFTEIRNAAYNGGEYILMENHSVFLIDKKVIPKMGWFDEKFVHGPHFDVDYMIRATERNINLMMIPRNNNYVHEDTHEETIQRGTSDVPDRLPMNTLDNEIYFMEKWESQWPGWKDYLDQVDKPHPPTNISQVKRKIGEIDFHPNYTKKFK